LLEDRNRLHDAGLKRIAAGFGKKSFEVWVEVFLINWERVVAKEYLKEKNSGRFFEKRLCNFVCCLLKS
jgi:hypothetical protein